MMILTVRFRAIHRITTNMHITSLLNMKEMTDEQRELYEEFFEFVNRVNNRQLNDSVFDRYFSKKIKVEQSKIIADKIIGLVEDAEIYELPLYGELNRRLKDIRFEMENCNCCYPERIRFMNECLEWGERVLAKIMRENGEPTSTYRPGRVSVIGSRRNFNNASFAFQIAKEMNVPTAWFFMDSYIEQYFKSKLRAGYPDWLFVDTESYANSAILYEKVRQLKELHNIQLVIVDNVHVVEYNDSLVGKRLKTIAEDFQVAVLLLSPLAKGKRYSKDNPFPIEQDVLGWEDLSPFVDNFRLLDYSLLHTTEEIQNNFEKIMQYKPYFIWREIPPVKVWYDKDDHSFHTSIGISLDYEKYEIDYILGGIRPVEYIIGVEECLEALRDTIEKDYKEKGIILHDLIDD